MKLAFNQQGFRISAFAFVHRAFHHNIMLNTMRFQAGKYGLLEFKLDFVTGKIIIAFRLLLSWCSMGWILSACIFCLLRGWVSASFGSNSVKRYRVAAFLFKIARAFPCFNKVFWKHIVAVVMINYNFTYVPVKPLLVFWIGWPRAVFPFSSKKS